MSWKNWAFWCQNPALKALPGAWFLPQQEPQPRVPRRAASWGTPASRLGTVAFQKYRSEPELQVILCLLEHPNAVTSEGTPWVSPAATCIHGNHPHTSMDVWHRQSPPETLWGNGLCQFGVLVSKAVHV